MPIANATDINHVPVDFAIRTGAKIATHSKIKINHIFKKKLYL